MPKKAPATTVSHSERGKGLPLFSPDILLPSQYYGQLTRQRQLTPEKKLLLAVLENAVYDIQRSRNIHRPRERRLFEETAVWFASEEDTAPMSFVAICHALDLDPDYIRRKVFSSTNTELDR
ncbi:MAG: hypothetical protein AB7G75_07840 [Candidatus Binatia bacterium]